MVISKVIVENARCFRKVQINFETTNNTPQWTTIVGDNGTGKSTLLKCIAIGLCDMTSAAGLLREIPWYFRNTALNKNSRIEIELVNDSRKKFKIITEIIIKNGIERIKRLIFDEHQKSIEDEDFPWKDIFICGYGAGRGTEGTVDYIDYSTINAVYTLFNYDQPLQNAELAMRRLLQRIREKRKYKTEDEGLVWLKDILKPILLLDKNDDILLDSDGLFVRSSKWNNVPISVLGDGYKSTLTWVMDFISWASLYYDEIIDSGMKGVVLVDEIDQHLHPKWQKEIVKLLRHAFPKVQFIVTTHSPLVSANAAFPLEESSISKLYYLGYENQEVKLTEFSEDESLLSCDQMLASEAFDFISNTNSNVEHILREASILAQKKNLTDDETKYYNLIKKFVKDRWLSESKYSVERDVEKEYYDKLLEEIKDLKGQFNKQTGLVK